MSESVDRRQFLQSATLAATAATAVTGAVTGTALAADARSGAKSASQHAGPMTRRWTEQRWLLDNTIRSVGMDWDQPRSVYLSAPCGPQAAADFAALRARIQKYADAAPAFEAAAKRREGVAKAALEAGDTVTARENYFIAAIHWGAAQWPIDEANAQNQLYNTRKRECYGAYAKLAEHRVEEAWIPMPSGLRLPAWFHLPPRYAGGRIPVVISVPGMDSFKEMGVSMYGFTDEARFDEFRKTMTGEGHAERVRVPYLCMAGEHDELSPLEHTERLLKALKGPKRWVVYQDSRHSVGGVPSANLGPNPAVHVADWMVASLAGKTGPSEKWFVTATGQIVRTPL